MPEGRQPFPSIRSQRGSRSRRLQQDRGPVALGRCEPFQTLVRAAGRALLQPWCMPAAPEPTAPALPLSMSGQFGRPPALCCWPCTHSAALQSALLHAAPANRLSFALLHAAPCHPPVFCPISSVSCTKSRLCVPIWVRALQERGRARPGTTAPAHRLDHEQEKCCPGNAGRGAEAGWSMQMLQECQENYVCSAC